MNEQFIHVIKSILRDLPTNRDWLDPEIEKLARHLVEPKQTSQPTYAEVICANDYPHLVVLNPTEERIQQGKERTRQDMNKQYGGDTDPNGVPAPNKANIYVHTKGCQIL